MEYTMGLELINNYSGYMDEEKITKYEKARILATRALQIAQGSPVLIEIPKGMVNPMEIAKLEWEKGVIPIEIKKKKD